MLPSLFSQDTGEKRKKKQQQVLNRWVFRAVLDGRPAASNFTRQRTAHRRSSIQKESDVHYVLVLLCAMCRVLDSVRGQAELS